MLMGAQASANQGSGINPGPVEHLRAVQMQCEPIPMHGSSPL